MKSHSKSRKMTGPASGVNAVGVKNRAYPAGSLPKEHGAQHVERQREQQKGEEPLERGHRKRMRQARARGRAEYAGGGHRGGGGQVNEPQRGGRKAARAPTVQGVTEGARERDRQAHGG